MTYSRIHQRFAAEFGNSKVLTNPEEFLGPNYETVLNFWKFAGSLEEEVQKEIMEKFRTKRPYLTLINSLCDKVRERIRMPPEIIFQVCSPHGYTIARATYEIILMDQLLEEGYKMTFLPMFEV